MEIRVSLRHVHNTGIKLSQYGGWNNLPSVERRAGELEIIRIFYACEEWIEISVTWVAGLFYEAPRDPS